LRGFVFSGITETGGKQVPEAIASFNRAYYLMSLNHKVEGSSPSWPTKLNPIFRHSEGENFFKYLPLFLIDAISMPLVLCLLLLLIFKYHKCDS